MENNWESRLVITYSHDSTEREMTSKKGTVMFPGRQEGVWRGEMVVSVDREVQEMFINKSVDHRSMSHFSLTMSISRIYAYSLAKKLC